MAKKPKTVKIKCTRVVPDADELAIFFDDMKKEKDCNIGLITDQLIAVLSNDKETELLPPAEVLAQNLVLSESIESVEYDDAPEEQKDEGKESGDDW